MTTTARETALSAFETLCRNTFGSKFARDPDEALDESADGTVLMRDGDPGEPEIMLSPVTYIWDHPVELEVAAIGASRRATIDGLMLQLDAALAANRTLGGKVTDARAMQAPLIVEEDGDGTATLRVASVLVNLNYQSSSPIG